MVDSKVSEDHYEIECRWIDFGFIERKGEGYKLKLPEGLPNEPGVYQIVADDAPEGLNQIYVGEGNSLFRRLGNYKNAGYRPGRKARTNRRVQGWIFDCIEQGHSVRLLMSTSAKINQVGENSKIMPIKEEHCRTLVESFVRARKSNLRFEN